MRLKGLSFGLIVQFFNFTHFDHFVKKLKENSDEIVLNKRATQSLKLQKAWGRGGGVFAPPQFNTIDARDLKWSLWH